MDDQLEDSAIDHSNKKCEYTLKWEKDQLKWQETVNDSEDNLKWFEELPMVDFPTEGDSKLIKIKDTLKSSRRPYKRFEGYYKLEDVIDQFMYIWFEDTTSSD